MIVVPGPMRLRGPTTANGPTLTPSPISASLATIADGWTPVSCGGPGSNMAVSLASAIRVSATAITAANAPDGTACVAEITTARALLRGNAAAASALMAMARSDWRCARSGCTRRSIAIVPSPSSRPERACAMSLVSINLREIPDRCKIIFAYRSGRAAQTCARSRGGSTASRLGAPINARRSARQRLASPGYDLALELERQIQGGTRAAKGKRARADLDQSTHPRHPQGRDGNRHALVGGVRDVPNEKDPLKQAATN